MIQKKTNKITLTTKEPFRIGGKSDPLSESENPVAVVGGRICIPGSSLKGALRGELERYLNNRFHDEKSKNWSARHLSMQPCIPATSLSVDEDDLPPVFSPVIM